MDALYVETVPDELYEALRKRARSQRRSIAAEVLLLLELHIPTKKTLKARRGFLKKLEQLRFTPSPAPGPFPSTEEMIREDRERGTYLSWMPLLPPNGYCPGRTRRLATKLCRFCNTAC